MNTSISPIGPQYGHLKETYEIVNRDLLQLVSHFKLYRGLYGRDEQTVKVMNAAAGDFFGILQGLLVDDIVLRIGRLLDPPQSSGKFNCTPLRLVELLDEEAEAVLLAAVSPLVADMQEIGKPFKQYRHKALAHRDERAAFDPTGKFFSGFSREDIDKMIDSFVRLMNALEDAMMGSEEDYKGLITRNPDEAILNCARARLWVAAAEDDGTIPAGVNPFSSPPDTSAGHSVGPLFS